MLIFRDSAFEIDEDNYLYSHLKLKVGDRHVDGRVVAHVFIQEDPKYRMNRYYPVLIPAEEVRPPYERMKATCLEKN